MALVCDGGRDRRLLIIPALFDEANRMRRFCVQLMRELDRHGIDSILPDLPGTHDSLEPLTRQTLATWTDAVASTAAQFSTERVLAIRAGAVLLGAHRGWTYAPISGATALRQLLRARLVASREAGLGEAMEALTDEAHRSGIVLAGYELGPLMFAALATHEWVPPDNVRTIHQHELGGAGLWLRAEPGEDEEQASALALLIAREWAQ